MSAPVIDDVGFPPIDPPSRAARLLFWVLSRIESDWRGAGLVIETPEGRIRQFGPPREPARLIIHDWRMVRRGLIGGDIGLADGYVAGEWDTPDLAKLLAVFADNFERLDQFANGKPLVQAVNWLMHRLGKLNTRRGSRKNIVAHYDLGNDFYGRWLDRSMTYSSALWPSDRKGGADLSLEAAQQAKYAALAESIDLRPGHRVLEIGCGWGGFAEYAARMGCEVVGLTLSPSQRDYAVARLAKAGFADRVEIRLKDYRDETETFDRIVSIEMFEAVGERWWPTFFRVVRERLTPGGRAGLQIITIRDDLFEGYRRRVDFIQRYVFPGGMLPSRARLSRLISEQGLCAVSERGLGLDYARTLNLWARNYRAASSGMDRTFDRLWLFYLAYCEAGFATGRTDVIQLSLSAPDQAR